MQVLDRSEPKTPAERKVIQAPGHTHFARSLLPVLAGETEEHRDAVVCEGGRLHGETHSCRALRAEPVGSRQAGQYNQRVRGLVTDDTEG